MQQPAQPQLHSASAGAGGSIIDILEGVESDFANDLAKEENQEADAQYSGDRETAQEELNAVLDFYGKIKERCIAKPEGYEARRRRREAEINGLKQALSILEDETALVQRKRRGSFRGALRA